MHTADDHLAVHHSTSSSAFLVATLILLALTLTPAFTGKGGQLKRPLFWCSVAATSLCAFMISAPNWKQCIAVGGFFVIGLTITAYMYTDNLKLFGKTYTYFGQSRRQTNSNIATRDKRALRSSDERKVDVYPSLVTSPKLWWTLTLGMVICSFGIVTFAVDHHGGRQALVSGAVMLILAIGFGYQDGSGGLPIARGQSIQFAIIAIVTAMAFPALYLLAYSISKKRKNR